MTISEISLEITINHIHTSLVLALNRNSIPKLLTVTGATEFECQA